MGAQVNESWICAHADTLWQRAQHRQTPRTLQDHIFSTARKVIDRAYNFSCLTSRA